MEYLRNQKKSTLIVLGILILMSLVLVLQMQRRQDNRTRAASEALEAESGVITGNAVKGSDTDASGGEYIEFGSGQ